MILAIFKRDLLKIERAKIIMFLLLYFLSFASTFVFDVSFFPHRRSLFKGT